MWGDWEGREIMMREECEAAAGPVASPHTLYAPTSVFQQPLIAFIYVYL